MRTIRQPENGFDCAVSRLLVLASLKLATLVFRLPQLCRHTQRQPETVFLDFRLPLLRPCYATPRQPETHNRATMRGFLISTPLFTQTTAPQRLLFL
ncbi:hypothetical protein [Kingella sp. (in: b-proteobacteria)]|uniref:hypothetical protein n=1 Tax=Kingella sp. (in: b-proteobacteria) TaxID=2020713 RepID=UPI0026DBBE38|nr:hypothetical protein [Kingella sp. (in: b-proteobacteria)]MDO4656433.1 hypothetical protein [Kingella sp. (in: b-proteobacteria)]